MEIKDKYSILGEALPQIIHDIRNPLNAIIGFSSILNMEDGFDEETKSYLGNIYESGNYIEKLLTLIDYFLVGRLQENKETISLENEWNQLIEEHKEMFNDKQISCLVDLRKIDDIIFYKGLFTRLMSLFFMFSAKGFKSVKSRTIEVSADVSDNMLKIYYTDSSNPVYIDGEYFTFEDMINSKRGIYPLFIEDIISRLDGKISYLSGNKWEAEIKQSGLKNNFAHGFIVVLNLNS